MYKGYLPEEAVAGALVGWLAERSSSLRAREGFADASGKKVNIKRVPSETSDVAAFAVFAFRFARWEVLVGAKRRSVP